VSAPERPSTTKEVEAKFRVHPPFELPVLVGDRTGAASVDQARDEKLRAVYWDTSDLRLAREGITLRHRSGEGDDKDGWHLKLPVRGERVPDASTASRDELHARGTDDQVPEELRDLVTAWVRFAVLGPVATLVTQRTLLVLRDAAGEALAEVTDDLVSVLNAGHVAGRFREIEVEDAGGGPAVLESVGAVLRSGGAVGGEFVPKVVRALGPQATAEADPPTPGEISSDDPARLVLRGALRRYVRDLLGQDVVVRRGGDDGVHQMRVAARRLRSALKTFRPLLDTEWANSLRVELEWLADSLGGARDSEVLLERLLADLDRLPADLVLGPVRARLEQVVGGDLVRHSTSVLTTLRSERYLALLERLVDAAWEPLTRDEAEAPASAALPDLLARTWSRLARDVERLDRPSATDDNWHRARIDTKAMRYVCDAVEPVFGRGAKRLSRRLSKLQDALGDHQDTVVARDTLRTIATAPRGGTVAFTLGLLHARQAAAAARSRVRFRRLWVEVARSRYRRWWAT
jgi:CHAD domain-containing protein